LRLLGAHDRGFVELEPVATANGRRDEASFMQLEETMAWTTPTIVEVCVGMEITAYSSAEI